MLRNGSGKAASSAWRKFNQVRIGSGFVKSGRRARRAQSRDELKQKSRVTISSGVLKFEDSIVVRRRKLHAGVLKLEVSIVIRRRGLQTGDGGGGLPALFTSHCGACGLRLYIKSDFRLFRGASILFS